MRPLEGVKVLDLSRVVTGPFCSMLLADLGAEVIKIEEPSHGDDSRAFGPPFVGGESAYFLSVNRNKRSCAINLKDPQGVELVRRLAASCDLLKERDQARREQAAPQQSGYIVTDLVEEYDLNKASGAGAQDEDFG